MSSTLTRPKIPPINGIEPITYKDDERGVVTVSLEDDPIHVMHMGTPFQTCLSPDDFNFFSAISNAADINKRVIFARDSKKQVVGRCLLALSDEFVAKYRGAG